MTRAEDDEPLRFYASSAQFYAAQGRDGPSRHLADFLARLPAGARILELGCGSGRDAAAMRAAGFEVDPTDGSPEMARRAEARLGRPVRVLRFHELAATAQYDAVWASAALLHVPRAALPEILARIRTALKPGGLHFASYKGGRTEGRDRHGRYFNYLAQDDLRQAYAASGPWQTLSLVEHLGGGYDPGSVGPWLAVTLRRPA